jgi:predicted TIM-barrel fold metal-dependent hydrolase
MGTRRSFLLTGACASMVRGSASVKRPIFDAHLHCPSASGDVIQWHRVTRNFQDFADYLARTGVERGIINNVRSLEAKKPADFVAGNREAARFAEQYKGRFLASCGVNPLFIDESLRELEDCRKQFGIVWVGELCNYISGYEYKLPQFHKMVEHLVELRMILHVHTEGDEMQYVMDRHPSATIVFAHFGDDKEYDDIFRRIDLVAAHPNCYLDTSGYGHDRVGVLEYAVEKIGPDRILYGSDFTINDPSTVIARIDNAAITPEQREKILWRNLEALLAKFKA